MITIFGISIPIVIIIGISIISFQNSPPSTGEEEGGGCGCWLFALLIGGLVVYLGMRFLEELRYTGVIQ